MRGCHQLGPEPTGYIKKYSDLWNVEAAFRVTKHDLMVRPVFHWKPDRIRAHIAICFMAYSLVKNLRYRVRLPYKKLSIEVISQSLTRVQTSVLYDKKKRIRYGLLSYMGRDGKNISGHGNQKMPYALHHKEDVVPFKTP